MRLQTLVVLFVLLFVLLEVDSWLSRPTITRRRVYLSRRRIYRRRYYSREYIKRRMCSRLKKTRAITKLVEKTDYISDKRKGNEILGLFNIHNKYNEINILDGVILAEAMKFAVERIREKINIPFRYKIVDLKGENTNAVNALATFPSLEFAAIISATEVHQTSFVAQLYGGEAYKIPIFNPLTSSGSFYQETGTSDGTKVRVYQTLPSFEFEVRAMIDILLRFNWTYVSIISSHDVFKQKSVDIFLQLAQRNDICIASRIAIQEDSNNTLSDKDLKQLQRSKKANVIVLFTLSHITEKVLNCFENITNLQFVSGTGWRASASTLKDAKMIAKGSIILQHANVFDKDFEEYFMNQTLSTNKDKWFQELWEATFNCNAAPDNKANNRPNCTGQERLNNSFHDIKHAVVRPLLDAVNSIACTVSCVVTAGKCKACTDYPSDFYKCIMARFGKQHGQCNCEGLTNLLQTNFSSLGHVKAFDLLSFDGKKYKNVGNWTYDESLKETNLVLHVDQIAWKEGSVPTSFCYHPCKLGEVKRYSVHGDKCCYTCRKCLPDTITSNGTCIPCGKHMIPNANRNVCNPLPLAYIVEEFPKVMAIRSCSCFGFIVNSAAIFIFVRYRDTKIVKATGRELSLLILLALYCCFLSPLIYLVKPSVIICGLQRCMVGFSFTSCYTPLMLKTNRIYRIFNAAEKLKFKPSLVTARSQILICLGVVSVQLLLCIIWVAGNLPEIQKEDVLEKTKTAVFCLSDSMNIVFNLLPCLMLMAACTFFGYKTRNYPSNFNEAFNISITMYISCFLWGIFIPLLFLFELKTMNVYNSAYLTASFMIVVGFVTLIGLFGPTLARLFLGGKSDKPTSQFFYCRNDFRSDTSSVISRDLATTQTVKGSPEKVLEDKAFVNQCFQLQEEDGTALKHRRQKEFRRRSESF